MERECVTMIFVASPCSNSTGSGRLLVSLHYRNCHGYGRYVLFGPRK